MPQTRVTGVFLCLILPLLFVSQGSATQSNIILVSSPPDPKGHLLRGRSLIVEKEFEKGIAELKKSLTLDPDNEQIYLDLARAYLAMKKPEEAEAILEQDLGKIGLI